MTSPPRELRDNSLWPNACGVEARRVAAAGRDPERIPLIGDSLGMSGDGDVEKAKLVSDSRYLAIDVQFELSLFFAFK